MATTTSENREGLTSLVGGVIQDGQELVRQQLQLFQVEVSQDLRRTVNASTFILVGALMGFLGALLLMVTIALWLHATWPEQLALWGAFGLVTVVIIGGAVAFLLWGKARFAAFNPLPDKSLDALKENFQWKPK